MKKNYPCLFLLLTFSLILSCNEQKYKDQPVEQAASPDWIAQTNIYEVNLRQFSAEGTIQAFEKALPRLKDMGVETLWFMPITPIGLEGRKETESDMGSYYAVKDYKGFNPDYGSLDDWKLFVKHAHEMGFKVITDWVANHSAPDNHWMRTHPDFYAKDKSGNTIAPFDWTDVRKLNYSNTELRDSMIDAMKFWITETGIDGFRCDVANEVPIDFWKTCIDEIRKIKPVFMLAEGDNLELYTAGFDALYSWDIFHASADLYAGKKTVKQFDSLVHAVNSLYPKNACRLFFTTNHDENSWNGTEFEQYGEAYKTFAVLSQTMYQSIPLIYNGQEDMNKKHLKFFVKDTIPWEGEMDLAPFYKTLLSLRSSNTALAIDATYKKLRSSADASIFAFAREKNGRKVVVILNLTNEKSIFTITDRIINGQPKNVFLGKPENIDNNTVMSLPAWDFLVYEYK